MNKEPKNSVANSEKRPGRRGGTLRSGNAGNRGGGRTPDEFKRRMVELVNRKDVGDYLEKCLRGDFGPKFFLSALQYVSDRGYGKPKQEVELSGPGGAIPSVTLRLVKAEGDAEGS